MPAIPHPRSQVHVIGGVKADLSVDDDGSTASGGEVHRSDSGLNHCRQVVVVKPRFAGLKLSHPSDVHVPSVVAPHVHGEPRPAVVIVPRQDLVVGEPLEEHLGPVPRLLLRSLHVRLAFALTFTGHLLQHPERGWYFTPLYFVLIHRSFEA
jgi:hypothetical protein